MRARFEVENSTLFKGFATAQIKSNQTATDFLQAKKAGPVHPVHIPVVVVVKRLNIAVIRFRLRVQFLLGRPEIRRVVLAFLGRAAALLGGAGRSGRVVVGAGGFLGLDWLDLLSLLSLDRRGRRGRRRGNQRLGNGNAGHPTAGALVAGVEKTVGEVVALVKRPVHVLKPGRYDHLGRKWVNARRNGLLRPARNVEAGLDPAVAAQGDAENFQRGVEANVVEAGEKRGRKAQRLASFAHDIHTVERHGLRGSRGNHHALREVDLDGRGARSLAVEVAEILEIGIGRGDGLRRR